jgi:DNA repair protein SbcC/Rad50
MRLHSLTMFAFGPYIGPVTIDFAALTASGLFLLEGPTGSGKSTILDAITFALYGSTASSQSAKERLRSDFVGRDVIPSVTLEFSVGDTRWEISRTPAIEVPQKRDPSKVRTENATALLRRWQGGQWIPEAQLASDAGKRIVEILRLNQSQFTQVVLLPQGEFARFLKSDDDDRREILTRIFSTGLYDRITAEIAQRKATASGAVQQVKQQVTAAVAAAGEAAGVDDDGRARLLELSAVALADELQSMAAGLKDHYEAATAAAEVARGNFDSLDADAGKAEQLHTLAGERDIARDALAKHEAGRSEYETQAARLEAARQAQPVRPLFEQIQDQDQAVMTLLAELPFESPYFRDEHKTGDGAIGLRQQETESREQAARLDHLVDLETELVERERRVKEDSADIETAKEELRGLVDREKALPVLIAEREAALAEAKSRAAGLEALTSERKMFSTKSTQASQLAKLQEELVDLEGRVARTREARDNAKKQHEVTIEQRIEGMAAELAQALTDGTPCPVCGNAEHPAKASAPGALATADDVNAAAAVRAEAEQRALEAEKKLQALSTDIASLTGALEGFDVTTMAQRESLLQQQCDAANAAAQSLPQLETALSDVKSELETVRVAVNSQTLKVAELETDLIGLKKSLETDSEKVHKGRGEYDSVRKHREALASAATALGALAGTVERLSDALGLRRRLEVSLASEAEKCGFSDVDQAVGAILEPNALAELAGQVSLWAQEQIRLNAASSDGRFASVETSQTADLKAQALALREQAHQAKSQCDAHEAAVALARKALNRFTECQTAVDGVLEQLGAAQAAAAPLQRLDGLARGVDGHRRMTLTTFVLRRWFEKVIDAANLRLATMSDRRYALVRSEDGQRKGARVGLGLAIMDNHTGLERPSGSLSGGETFYTSLALALGMSDVVKSEAGGVELDTLFIDEGFGTLDPHTLDSVMGVIDDLRDRGRVIGIVSHVEELKERIAERVTVSKLSDGSSTLSLVC